MNFDEKYNSESFLKKFGDKIHPAILWESKENNIICTLCNHYCEIPDGKKGTCYLRINLNGNLYTQTWGKTKGLAIDPIEKKPFFHFKPGSRVLSFGTPGCNFRCKNCQNSTLSQAVRNFGMDLMDIDILPPNEIISFAEQNNVDGIAYTYSEPTIFFEYARDTILEARKNKKTKDLFHLFISNGYFSKEMLEIVKQEKLLDAINIDLKFMEEKKYLDITGGKLKPVLDNIKRVADCPDIHLEIINLVISGVNDTMEEVERTTEFLLSVSPDIPMHFSRFYPQHKMTEKPPTSVDFLINARNRAMEMGLKYVFLGNTRIPGTEDTICPNCGETLISRTVYGINKNVFEKSNSSKVHKCPSCEYEIKLFT